MTPRAHKANYSFPKKFWKGFWIIVAAYTLVQLFPTFPKLLQLDRSILFRQLARLLAVLVVYVTGARVLGNSQARLLLFCWHAIHLVFMGLLLGLAMVEWGIKPISFGIRASIAPIIEFLISPLLYLAAGLLHLAFIPNTPEA